MPSVADSYNINLLPSLEALSETQFVSPPAAALPPVPADSTVVYPLFTGSKPPKSTGYTAESLVAQGFEGEPGDVFVIPAPDSHASVLVGLGDRQDEEGEGDSQSALDNLRTAGAASAGVTRRYSSVYFSLPSGLSHAAVVEFVVGYLLARYEYKVTNQPGSVATALATLTLVAQGFDEGEVASILSEAAVYTRATFVARDLTNASPGHLNPSSFPAIAEQLGADWGFGVEVFDLEQLRKMGCGGIVGVNRGSTHGAHLIHLVFDPRDGELEGVGQRPTRGGLALVGKGITFDSGGLSLKPSASMLEMKMDMGGAAAILGAFTAFVDLGTRLHVEAWLPITDNMVSGDSMRVGEIITARNGLTVEVTNTDAEGRLVLMDGLSLAAESKPQWIVDIATLTGAQTVALGAEIAAVVGNNQELIRQVERSAEEVGELVWQLPLYRRYLKILSSEVADVANANLKNRNAGTITASLFLSQFVGDTPWAHLDIAGPMSAAAKDRWLVAGATGFGARLLARLSLELPTVA